MFCDEGQIWHYFLTVFILNKLPVYNDIKIVRSVHRSKLLINFRPIKVRNNIKVFRKP